MKVAIITTEDLFYVRYFFEKFFAHAKEGAYELSGITILPAFNKPLPALVKQMLGFYGLRYFLMMGFSHVWRKITGKTIEDLAQKEAIPFVEVTSVNSPEYLKWLKENKIDLIISIASPEIFKSELLATPPKGCINSHSALLPENRGMMPVFWALYKRSKELGVTIHTMESKLDSGDILMQEIVANSGESLDAMILKTKEISARLMHQTIEAMVTEEIKPIPMAKGGSYQTFPTPAQAKEFVTLGNRFF